MSDDEILIRNVARHDLVVVRALNDIGVPHVNAVPDETLEWFMGEAAYFKVAESAEGIAGFLIAFTPGSTYPSPNYRWFCERFDSFVYIDRVVVDERLREHGIGSRLYEDVARYASVVGPMLACEVNLQPPNEASLRFHERRGFRNVGTQTTEGGAKEVSLMVRALALEQARAQFERP